MKSVFDEIHTAKYAKEIIMLFEDYEKSGNDEGYLESDIARAKAEMFFLFSDSSIDEVSDTIQKDIENGSSLEQCLELLKEKIYA